MSKGVNRTGTFKQNYTVAAVYALGSVTRLTDSSSRVSHRYFYSPFGKSAGFGSVAGNPFTYTGRRLDPTGLLFYRSRYMMPGVGRFMQADRWGGSAWSPWRSHPFIYVNNNPMAFVDPYGLRAYSLSGVLKNYQNFLTGISDDIYEGLVYAKNNLGTMAAGAGVIAAGSVWVPTATAGAIIGSAAVGVGDAVNDAIQLALKGKDNSKAIGKAVGRLASFYVVAKNAEAAVKKMGDALRETAGKIKKLVRAIRSGDFVGAGTKGGNNFLNNATTPGKGGVSPVGRALQKHASRQGSFFQGATGNAAKNTQIGAQYLDDILQNGTVTQSTHKAFGDVIKVRMSNGAGAWWKADGSFIGFLEP